MDFLKNGLPKTLLTSSASKNEDVSFTVTFLEVHELMAQANLVLQTIVLFLIIFAILLERKKMFVWHGNVMLVAAIITGLLLVMHMGPTFFRVVGEGLSLDGVALFGIVHGIFGAVAWSLALWLTVTWAHLESSTRFCVMKKKWMRRIVALWIIALGLGYVYYVIHIVWS
jgi:uncharacterized membrane protein YozB (DUF420 family)